MSCPLCCCEHVQHLTSDRQRTYFHCPSCELVFVPAHQHVGVRKEKERYAHHDNLPDNADYRRYLQSVGDELRRIPIRTPRTLDFGSGPAAVLTGILSKQGLDCRAYDPLYGIDGDALAGTYDIVIACEVIEHLRDVRRELLLIGRLLEPGGYVLIRTKLYQRTDQFPGWWYCADPTHINFLSKRTMRYVAQLLERRVCYCDGRCVSIIGPDSCSTAPRTV